MMASLIGFAGWAGAGCMLLAYALLSTRRIPAGLAFQTLNLSGAFGLLLNGASHRAWPSVLLNLAWLVISFAALARQRQRSRELAPDVAARLSKRAGRPRHRGRPRYRLYREPAAVATPRVDLSSPNWIEARSL